MFKAGFKVTLGAGFAVALLAVMYRTVVIAAGIADVAIDRWLDKQTESYDDAS